MEPWTLLWSVCMGTASRGPPTLDVQKRSSRGFLPEPGTMACTPTARGLSALEGGVRKWGSDKALLLGTPHHHEAVLK